MRKQLTLLAGILVMLGAAASGALSNADPISADAGSAASPLPLDSAAADQLIARWNAVPSSEHLARPL